MEMLTLNILRQGDVFVNLKHIDTDENAPRSAFLKCK